MKRKDIPFLIFVIFLLLLLAISYVREPGIGHASTSLYSPDNVPKLADTPTPAPGGAEALRLEKSLDRTTAGKGEEITVSLTLSADSSVCGQEVIGKPLDAVLVIDRSGSMSGRKMSSAKEAAKAFVDEMNVAVDRVAVIKFSGDAELLQTLSHNAGAVKAGIDRISSSGGTSIDRGLETAHYELIGNGRADVTLVIVILSDGKSDFQDAVEAAKKAKADGIRIVSVGVGGDVDKKLMQQIASSRADGQPDYHFSPDASHLKDIYVSIAQQIREFVTVTNIEIRHTFDPTKIEVVPGSISDGGSLAGETANNVIVWQLDKLGEQPRTVSYRARVQQHGQFFLDESDQLSYTLCEKETRSFSTKPGLELQVPVPTPTRTPGVFIPGVPTPVSPILEAFRPSQPLFCTSRYWWVPALLLPLLLVLLLVLLLWWWSWRNRVTWYNLWLEWRWPCRFLSILSLLYLLLLAFLIGREFFVGLCKPTEAVYFWRLDEGEGDFGIFLTNQSEGAQPVSFKALNQGGCVGCHSVSTASHRIAAVRGPIPDRGVVYSLAGEKVEIPPIDAIYYGWSPDGQKLAFADSRGDIHLLDLQTVVVTPLEGASDPALIETMPAWSPDGQTIAFVRSAATLGIGGTDVEGPSDIYTVPASGGQPQPLPGGGGEGFNYYPAYSPDGQWLAFTHHTTGYGTYSDPAAEIYIVPASGGQPRRLQANDAPGGTALQNVSNSWPTWSRDGRWLAFNSKRNDPAFDVFVTAIDQNGNSGPAIPLPGASAPGVFEHTPFWGEPLQLLPLWQRLLNLWPWLIPLLLLFLLRWLLCRAKKEVIVRHLPELGARPQSREPVSFKAPPRGLPPEWDPAPTLVIGLGGTGRWVLTHLKKNLLDAGAGQWREQVRLLLLDTALHEVVQGQEISVQVGGVSLKAEEQLILGEDLRELIQQMAQNLGAEPEMQSWFPAQEYVRVRRLPDAQMDVRRTTNQRRPMGRAIVFDDVRQGEASRLWTTLSRGVRQVLAEERVRVIIVGSLGGGFGSGALADVAYLVRRAAGVVGQNASTVITAFLVTDNAFVTHSRSLQLKLNTMATLRELGRFLLARGRPFPMTYNRRERDEVFNGFIEWSLFDEVFLLDGQRPQYALTLLEPERGMFPLIADLITTFIDRGSRLMEEVRSNLRTEAADVQVKRGEPAVGALGGYTYRLPLQDLVRGLKLRFAHDLLMLYLVGPDYRKEEIVLSPDLCQDKYPDGLKEMIDHFLRGSMYGENEGVGGATTFIADLARGGDVEPGWYWLEVLPREGGVDWQEHLKHFQAVLQSTVLRHLNGRPQDEITMARSGKLGYTLAFLDELSATLERARTRAEYLTGPVVEDRKTGPQALLNLVNEEKRLVATMREQMVQGITSLLDQESGRRPGERPAVPGLVNVLRERLAQECRWREEMRRIPVRRVLAEESFFEQLYRDFFAPHLTGEALEHLYWGERADGKLGLVLRHWEDIALSSDEEGQEQFLAGLLALAEMSGQEVWRLRLASFLDDSERGLWNEQQIRQEVDEARAWAEAVTTVQTGKAPEQQPHRYLWVNETVQRRETFAREVQLTTNMREEVQRLSATDPYSATLITSLDILPLAALNCTARLETDYKNVHQIVGVSEMGDERARPEPVHVFAAESHALIYEQRLKELREPPRLFHPLFVAALENLERARTFVLAHALEWIKRQRFREQGEWRERYVLALPGEGEEIPLTRGDRSNDPVALVVRAMQGFVLGHPQEDMVQQQYSPEELARKVRERVEEHMFMERETLQTFLREKPADLAGENRIGAKDFWSFAQLVIQDELQGMAR